MAEPSDSFIAALASGTTDPAPRVEVFLPETNPTETGVIIFPGGGYRGHAEHEGRGYGEFLQANGFAAFVTSYRLGPDGFRHPAMLEDALAALETLRTRAADFGVAPHRLGLMGSSAGGHLAAHALTAFQEYERDVPLRPSFGILCYPVITMVGDFAHADCRTRLLGEAPSSEVLQATSPQHHVTPDTPPCFLWHTLEDASVPVENSLMFASALREQAVPFELHIYPRGRHGLGLITDLNWGQDALRWLRETVLSGGHHDH